MNIIGLGQAGCNIADAMAQYPQYNIYKIDVDVNFTKFKELLVLADKYQVDDLLKYCEEQIIKSLNNENALEVGIFAETHNAHNLLEECIHFILNNVPHSLSKDWAEKIEGSPKMMVKIIKYLLHTHIEGRIYEIKGSFQK